MKSDDFLEIVNIFSYHSDYWDFKITELCIHSTIHLKLVFDDVEQISSKNIPYSGILRAVDFWCRDISDVYG